VPARAPTQAQGLPQALVLVLAPARALALA
jgi:hypothetical protein